MTEPELLENVKCVLRKAIASRIKITKADSDTSLDTKSVVNRWLTNVMSIGYNLGDIDEAIEELCVARHYGNENDEAVINAMRKEVFATQNMFGSEIGIFAKMHELNQAGADFDKNWEQIQAIVDLADWDRG